MKKQKRKQTKLKQKKPNLMTILVVDDEKELRETLKNALELEGYDVILAENGLVGFTLAQEKKPDLILLDISMPVMDGFTTLFKLKQNPSTKDIPVIILTGQYVDEENLERGFNLGAVEYLYKPIKLAELTARVRSVLRMKILELEAKKAQTSTAKFFINEIKRIFSTLKGVMEILILSEGISGEFKASISEDLKKLKKWFEVVDYYTIINDIVAGVEKMDMRIVDLSTLLKNLIEEVKGKYESVKFELNLAREAIIQGDDNLLRAGFKIFIDSVSEGMPSGGTISITQTIRSGKDGRFVFVVVRDEAQKLPLEFAKILFNPYALSNFEFTPPYNLLGLKVFQMLIELHGGFVLVEPSELTSGNKFIIQVRSA